MSDSSPSLSQNASLVERTLYGFNSVLVFWFFAFLITGPKSSLATTALLILSLAKTARYAVLAALTLGWS